jgi:tripartite-type tricarboxylate transporter receptor subunit TctC
VVAPAGTPQEIVARLSAEIVKAARTPSMQRFNDTGARALGSSPDEFAAFVRSERTKWGEIVRSANISAE